MDNLTIAAASGLRSRMESLDLLANNLANTATTGFKRDLEFYGTYSSADSDDPVNGGPSSTLPTIEKQWTDFSQGTIQVTGNPLDVALQGSGFLAVSGPQGALYTRAGNLKVLASGALATSDSYPVRSTTGDAIRIAPNKPIAILPDGTVQQSGQPVGQLSVVNFQIHRLSPENGEHLFPKYRQQRMCPRRYQCERTTGKDRRFQRSRGGCSHAAGWRDAPIRDAAESNRAQQRHGY
jgi:flagellar basal-body rod protein FlgF